MAKRNRDNYIHKEVLQRAKGFCENCQKYSPFILEVHHLKPVSKGGGDTPDNMVAICPNCHSIIEKMKTKMLNNPRFHDWIRERYGEEIYIKLWNFIQ